MIATEFITLLKTAAIDNEGHSTLPSNARDVIVEVHLTGSAAFKIMTSHDQQDWHQVGTTTHSHSVDVIIELKDHSLMQYVCIQPTSNPERITSAKAFFGRIK
jgi:hypothetical protein